MSDLIGQEVTIYVEMLTKPVGGWVIGDNERFIVLRNDAGNEVRIPQGKVNSILIKTNGGTNKHDKRNA
jgi:hypothetical protein